VRRSSLLGHRAGPRHLVWRRAVRVDAAHGPL